MFVYLISNGNETKIGVSNKPAERLNTIQTISGRQLSIDYVWNIQSTKAAYKLEGFLHAYFHQYRKSGEWFAISSNKIIDALAEIKPLKTNVKMITKATSDTQGDTQGKQDRVRGVCPQCGTHFKPVNKWHTFCCSTCRDAYHNERNPERKQHMKRRKG